MSKKTIAIIIPCFNEEKNIELLVTKLIESFDEKYNYSLLFIDDNSNDSSLDIIKSLSNHYPFIYFISFSRNFGHQSAIMAGYDFADADAIITMDADLQHPPYVIKELVQKWEEGYDIVYTSRKDNKSEISFIKKATSSLFYKLINVLSDVRIEKNSADFRLISKKIQLVIKNNINERNLFLRGIIPWLGYKHCSIEFFSEKRHEGESKYSLLKMVSFAIDGITSFSIRPLRFASVLGIIITASSFIYAIYSLYMSLTTNKNIVGWTSVILCILIIGGIQIFILGIIGEYIGKIFIESKQRPLYLIKDQNINNQL